MQELLVTRAWEVDDSRAVGHTEVVGGTGRLVTRG